MLICHNVNKRYNQVFFNLDALAPDFIESINVYVYYILICSKEVQITEDKSDPSLCIRGQKLRITNNIYGL